MSFQNGDPLGGSVPPSTIGYELGESLGAIPSGLKFRQYYQEHQPTIGMSSGMHSLPPVPVRIPIADQYAIGISHPDVTMANVPDPTIFKNVNGNVSLGQTPESRREAQMGLRSKMQQLRRGKNTTIG